MDQAGEGTAVLHTAEQMRATTNYIQRAEQQT